MNGTPAIADRYRRFVVEQVRGRSPLYEDFALAVADSDEALGFLAELPAAKQQPNLLLAALRHVCGLQRDGAAFLAALRDRAVEIRTVMLARATQTNEPGRCALLLPVLSRLPQPLALFEIGTSAGLCLLADRYGYDYAGTRLMPPGAEADIPVFPCTIEPPENRPYTLPTVVWRRGLDLNPIDAGDAAQTDWLKTLVWPEHTERADRLDSALAIARADPPMIERRSLLDPLDRLFDDAPPAATRVLFHSSVLAYIEDVEARRAVCDRIQAACDVWICNEAPRILPWIAEKAPTAPPADKFMQAVDGEPVAWTDPHGTRLVSVHRAVEASPKVEV